MDIVVIGLQSWDIELGSNCIDIAKELIRYHRVLYVNYPLDRMTILRHRKNPLIQNKIRVYKKLDPDLIQLQENLWIYTPRVILESINRIHSTLLFDFFNKLNNERFARKIKQACARIGFKKFILFNDNDIYRAYYFKKLLNPELFIYYSRDNMIETDYYRKHGTRLEGNLIRQADLTFTNSTYLEDYARKFTTQAFFVGQGWDVNLYTARNVKSTPQDIEKIQHPIIGYTGAIRSLRLDIELLIYLAKNRLDWNIVLIGPEDEQFTQSELHQLPNVIFLGRKELGMLPTYIHCFDVAINPQAVNPVTIGNYPRKIDEYLAMGKPVVATRTKAMEIFSGITYLADDYQGFLECIEQALVEDSLEKEQQRVDFASDHTWENVVMGMNKLITQYVPKS